MSCTEGGGCGCVFLTLKIFVPFEQALYVAARGKTTQQEYAATLGESNRSFHWCQLAIRFVGCWWYFFLRAKFLAFPSRMSRYETIQFDSQLNFDKYLWRYTAGWGALTQATIETLSCRWVGAGWVESVVGESDCRAWSDRIVSRSLRANRAVHAGSCWVVGGFLAERSED